MNYLLLISCSERKRQDIDSRLAIDVYDGPVYRMLRKTMRERGTGLKNLDILIISAKHGLLRHYDTIDPYDQKMTPERAAQLAPAIQSELYRKVWIYGSMGSGVRTPAYNQVFINLGKTYMQTLDGFYWGFVSTLEASGGIGQRVSQTKAFLERIALEANPYIESIKVDNPNSVS